MKYKIKFPQISSNVLRIISLTVVLIISISSYAQVTKIVAEKQLGSKEEQETIHSEIGIVEVPGNMVRNNSKNRSPLALMATMAYLEEDINIPNNTFATALALGSTDVKVRGNIFPIADQDYYSFTAVAGDRVYAAVLTTKSANNLDSYLTLFASDGTTILEFDNDDGSFTNASSGIAGSIIPSDGIYYLSVRQSTNVAHIRPYDLYLKVQSGTPSAEVEPNNSIPGVLFPNSGWVSGSINPLADLDFYSIDLLAGETVFVSLDLDPERDAITWNGRTGLGIFSSNILVVNDGNLISPNSESFCTTVKTSGTYYIYIDHPTNAGTGTYVLSASILPAPSGFVAYNSADATLPLAIPTGPAIVSSTLNITDVNSIKKLKVNLNLSHANMPDLDVELTSPSGNTVTLFTDIGAIAFPNMNISLNDDAAIPFAFTVVDGLEIQLELNYLLNWFQGQPSNGTWTLTLRDDAASNGGTLNSWGLEILAEAPIPMGTIIFTTDFETDTAGFTHSGISDEWERGLPILAPITSANSGTNCFKTDLDNTYNSSSTGILKSPNIVIPTISPGNKAYVKWAMKYQMESATFDSLYVMVREVMNPGNSKKAWQWMGNTMTSLDGNPAINIQESAGWGYYTYDISSFSGKTIEFIFYYKTDTSAEFAGCAIDDITVFTTCTTSASITNNTPVSCFGGSNGALMVTVSSGTANYSYVWSHGPSTLNTASTTNTVTGLLTGTYTVTVTDGNACATTASVMVSQPTAIIPSATVTSNYNGAQISCFGASDGQLTASASGGTGGYTYMWSNGPTTQNNTNLATGTYVVTVTDANSCTATTSVMLSEPSAINPSASVTSNYNGAQISCVGASDGQLTSSASGGTGGYTYMWSNGPATQNNTNLAAGTYVVTISDANGCTATASVTLTPPPSFVLTTLVTNVSCNGASNGTVDLTVSGGTGGYSYQWSNGSTTQDIMGLAIGTYTVIVSDDNGCTSTTSATVSVSLNGTYTFIGPGSDFNVSVNWQGGCIPPLNDPNTVITINSGQTLNLHGSLSATIINNGTLTGSFILDGDLINNGNVSPGN